MQYNISSDDPTTHQVSSGSDFKATIQFQEVPEDSMYQEHVRGSHYKKSLLLESEKSLKRQEERESKSRHSSMASLGEKSRNGSTNHVAAFAIPNNHHNIIGE